MGADATTAGKTAPVAARILNNMQP